MILNTQIKLIIFSFIYGIFLSFFFGLNYKYIYSDKKEFQIIITFLCIVISVLSYFIGIQKICFGIVHPYSFIFIILGFFVEHFLYTFIDRRFKK